MDASLRLNEMEQALEQAETDKTLALGKFELVADTLHDIGNAIVGFGLYLTRIRRSMEQNSAENLLNLTGFFKDRLVEIGGTIGTAKAEAVVNMLQSIVSTEESTREEIQKTIGEQLNIIAHIQEILAIQRQYVVCQEPKQKQPVNLRTLITDCLAMLFASLEKRGIKVDVTIAAASPIIRGNRTRLMQVILNLLKNSVESMNANEGAKTIGIHLHDEQELLVLEIKDSGTGFSEATSRLLFDRGFTTKSSGTGLGLHSCKAIIEDHDATIAITSEGPGMGALTIVRFKF